jgi:hypothetical protein
MDWESNWQHKEPKKKKSSTGKARRTYIVRNQNIFALADLLETSYPYLGLSKDAMLCKWAQHRVLPLDPSSLDGPRTGSVPSMSFTKGLEGETFDDPLPRNCSDGN